jgi:hypothetical protein
MVSARTTMPASRTMRRTRRYGTRLSAPRTSMSPRYSTPP